MIYTGENEEYLQLENIHSNNCIRFVATVESPLTFLWFEKDRSTIVIDNIEYTFNSHQIICLTEFHKVEITDICNAKMLRFNRAFYCILDHDAEIGCKGILFFGASQLPIIHIPDAELEKFQIIWRMMELELESKDDLQLDMLQSMLKRFIIMCTRIFKNQENYNKLDHQNIDIVREYNFLVENHFKTKHTVVEYATMLNKSPKTLSNIFAKISDKSPLQFIQERKILEAKRLLKHSDLTIKEIAYELGFEDIQAFSRFFKKMEKISPSNFKK